MKPIRWLIITTVLVFAACQSPNLPTVTIIDNERIIQLQTDKRVPVDILNQAGITLLPEDRVLLNGSSVALDQSIADFPLILQIRRAATVVIASPEGQQTIQTSAFTVGEALHETGIQLRAGEKVDPPLKSPLASSMEITIFPAAARELTFTADGMTFTAVSSAQTVGEALAEAGIPLIGLDYSVPAENEELPPDGQVKAVRVSESVLLAQKPLPFESELQASADVPLDQTQILQPGETGLNVQRIRIRYDDGVETSRVSEDETLVRPSKTRLLGYGTKVEIKTAVVDGVQIEYWRAVQMYATSYSPCRSGTDECHGGTSSGQSLRKGMVGLRQSWYLSMQGQRLYIPGYGFSTVEDVCGGCVGRPWIDLGYSDNDYEPWSSWVTVYFLTPVPANIIYVLE
ncbi:MAG TPA: ubiquitin-like domain-containing protein [Anaerolineales bacterium]|nr:ubiquitin-like domain-containing protein [Anaerolineales bacterium]